MKATLFNAEVNRKSDTLVISPYPLVGDDRNTGHRYQAEAYLTGFDIAGLTKTGTRTARFSPRMRRIFSSRALFDELCAEEAAWLNPLTEDFDKVIVRGQSTGGFSALSMVKSQELRVTHLLLEDGLNMITRPDGRPQGFMSARLNWYRYGEDEKARADMRDGWTLPVKASALPPPRKLAKLQNFWLKLAILQTFGVARTVPTLP